MSKKVVAIIPARGGSKRLPKKNIMRFLGKPMIYWTIYAAKESGIFDTILVSTDSEEISEVAQDFGADVPFLRNMEDADDHVSVNIATTNALIQLENSLNTNYDIVVQLMPNCPLRSSSDIQSAYDTFVEKQACFQISAFELGWMNPWWSMRLDKSTMQPTPIFPEALKQRSQDLTSLYCPTGAVWIADSDQLKQQKTFYGKGYILGLLDWQSAIDIDNIEDFKFAEAVACMHQNDKYE
jgi:CMP-N-acetylneuraminic acid synthetase